MTSSDEEASRRHQCWASSGQRTDLRRLHSNSTRELLSGDVSSDSSDSTGELPLGFKLRGGEHVHDEVLD